MRGMREIPHAVRAQAASAARSLLVLALVAVIGCSVPAGRSGSITPSASPVPSFLPGDSWAGLPLDPTITPVSRSRPDPHAQWAMDACGITASDPSHVVVIDHIDAGQPTGLDRIAGMGLVPRAADVREYAPTGNMFGSGDNVPVWVINTVGVVDPMLSYRFRNASCIIRDGAWRNPSWVGGDEIDDSGLVVATDDPKLAPTLHLPPLAP